MKLKFPKIQRTIKKNLEFVFLLLTIIVTILSVRIYNVNKNVINQNYINLINNTYFQKSIKHVFDNLEPKFIDITHKVSKGETFNKILNSYEIPKSEIQEIIKILSKENKLNNLKTNQIIIFTIDQSENNKITNLLFPISRTKKIQLTRDLISENFKRKEIITNLNKKIIFREGKILKSLYKTAIDLEIQANVIIEFARIYGFQVDFQRDIRKGDGFQIMYEVLEDDEGKVFETGNVIFADLILRNQKNTLYYFDKKNSAGHYDKNGKSVKKALMKTPINGARLS